MEANGEADLRVLLTKLSNLGNDAWGTKQMKWRLVKAKIFLAERTNLTVIRRFEYASPDGEVKTSIALTRLR